jgi:hypothetical protein
MKSVFKELHWDDGLVKKTTGYFLDTFTQFREEQFERSDFLLNIPRIAQNMTLPVK